MTDVEADDQSYREGKRGVRKIARQVERRSRIDYSQMNEQEKRTAENRDRVMTSIAVFGRRELRKAQRALLLSVTTESVE